LERDDRAAKVALITASKKPKKLTLRRKNYANKA